MDHHAAFETKVKELLAEQPEDQDVSKWDPVRKLCWKRAEIDFLIKKINEAREKDYKLGDVFEIKEKEAFDAYEAVTNAIAANASPDKMLRLEAEADKKREAYNIASDDYGAASNERSKIEDLADELFADPIL
jgi:hypothetical protein